MGVLFEFAEILHALAVDEGGLACLLVRVPSEGVVIDSIAFGCGAIISLSQKRSV